MLPVLETPLSGEPNRDVIIEAWSEITTELLTKKDLDLLDAHRLYIQGSVVLSQGSVVLCGMDFIPILIYPKL